MLLALGCSALAQQPDYRFGGFSVYGTEAFDADDLSAEFGDAVGELVETIAAAGPDVLDGVGEAWMDNVRQSIVRKGDFAYVNVGGLMGSGEPGVIQLSVTVEVVEAADGARRMPFRAAPTGTYEDPDGVVAEWEAYFNAAMPLMLSGELFEYDDDCPVLHCFFPFAAPALVPFLEKFNAAAAEHEALLYEIAANDRLDDHRVAALRTLAHSTDVERLLPLLASAIYDPHGEARNDAMRIMLYIADTSPELDYPVGDLIDAMDFPSLAERNKAVTVLSRIAHVPRHAESLRRSGLPNVLRLLRTTSPLTHEPAYQILTTLSGLALDANDYEAWEDWAATVPAAE